MYGEKDVTATAHLAEAVIRLRARCPSVSEALHVLDARIQALFDAQFDTDCPDIVRRCVPESYGQNG